MIPGLTVNRDEIVGRAKTIAQLCQEVKNISDSLVVTDLEHNRRQRARIAARTLQLWVLATEIDEMFP